MPGDSHRSGMAFMSCLVDIDDASSASAKGAPRPPFAATDDPKSVNIA